MGARHSDGPRGSIQRVLARRSTGGSSSTRAAGSTQAVPVPVVLSGPGLAALIKLGTRARVSLTPIRRVALWGVVSSAAVFALYWGVVPWFMRDIYDGSFVWEFVLRAVTFASVDVWGPWVAIGCCATLAFVSVRTDGFVGGQVSDAYGAIAAIGSTGVTATPLAVAAVWCVAIGVLVVIIGVFLMWAMLYILVGVINDAWS